MSNMYEFYISCGWVHECLWLGLGLVGSECIEQVGHILSVDIYPIYLSVTGARSIR